MGASFTVIYFGWCKIICHRISRRSIGCRQMAILTHHTTIHIYFILSFSLSLSLVRVPLSVCLLACSPVCAFLNEHKTNHQLEMSKRKIQKTIVNWFCYFIRYQLVVCCLVIFHLFSVHYFFLKFNKQFNVLNSRKEFHSENTANFSHPTAVSLTLTIFRVFRLNDENQYLSVHMVIENKGNYQIEWNKFCWFWKVNVTQTTTYQTMCEWVKWYKWRQCIHNNRCCCYWNERATQREWKKQTK